jgi:cell division septation protein DedD
MSLKFAACCSFLLFIAGISIAESRYAPAVRQTLSAAYSQEDQPSIIAALVAAAAKADKPVDRKAFLSSLADYEERNGLASPASKHYNDAAFADPKARDDGLLLDSARCAFASGDVASADGSVRAVLLTCFDEKTLVRARVYAAWISLCGGDDVQPNPTSATTPSALSLIRSYADNPAFAVYAPALLFTLWWSSGDTDAKTKLLASFPGSPEASIVRGEMALSPTPFWYLMARDPAKVAAFARAGNQDSSAAQSPTVNQTASGAQSPAVSQSVSGRPPVPDNSQTAGSAAAGSSGIWQQAGFFRNRDNAEDLRSRLAKLGFKALIREEKRPSGTVYFSVLVPGDAKGEAAARLKDAGFESCLVTD